MVEVYEDDAGREVNRITEDGVRIGNMLSLVGGEDADKVLKALLAGSAEGR